MTQDESAREALEELDAFLERDLDLEVATAARVRGSDDAIDGRYLPLASDAEAYFRGAVIKAATGATKRDFRKLDLLYKPDELIVEWEAINAVAAIELACERHGDLNAFSKFNPKDEAYKKRLAYWVCILADQDERMAFFFKAFSGSVELSQKRSTAMVLRAGAFTKVSQHIFLFDDSIDCFVFDDHVFVLDKPDYRRVFNQLERIRMAARDAALALHEAVPIVNFQAFADACSKQAGMADKILAVSRRDYFSRLSYEMLKPIIDEFNLDIPVELHDGNPHIVFVSDPVHRWRILRLVDDDYLKSTMTGYDYEVTSKGKPPRRRRGS